MLVTSGCSATFYHARYPILPLPDNADTWQEARPQMQSVSGADMGKMSPEGRKAIADNLNGLIDYSRKLEATIEKYNNYATVKNEVLDEIGTADKKKKKGIVGKLFN
jgi:hypothetical protein